MTMTREEAISELQACVDAWDKWMLPGCSSLDKYKEAVRMSLAALRGPTREQVEKLRGEVNKVDKFLYACSRCGSFIDRGDDFCCRCGAPLTGEAVDILMKKMEALFDETKAD